MRVQIENALGDPGVWGAGRLTGSQISPQGAALSTANLQIMIVLCTRVAVGILGCIADLTSGRKI